MKTIDTTAYISQLREITETGESVCIPISGNSMSPFLVDQRDFIQFQKPTAPLTRGDMVFFQRQDGSFIMHRVYRVRPEGLYIVGDAQQIIEGPVLPSQVFAIVTAVKRKGKWIGPKHFWWIFFRSIWLELLPFRPYIRHLYGGLHHIFTRRKAD